MNNLFGPHYSQDIEDDLDAEFDEGVHRKPSAKQFLGEEEDIFAHAPHRSPRMEELKKELARNRTSRPLNDMEAPNIDEANIPANRTYGFVQLYSQGEGYTPEIVKAYKEGGWKPVKKVRHPELTMLTDEDLQEIDEMMMEHNRSDQKAEIPVLTRSDRYIRFGGLILMEKDIKANQMAIDRIHRKVDLQYQSIQKEEFNRRHSGNPDMKMFML